ncbi:MAG: hypothetical protein ACNA8W_02785, partial [Bradymonadaceae bacterium]
MNQSSHCAVKNTGANSSCLALLLTLLCAVLILPADLQAQESPELPSLQLQRFRLAPGPGDYLTVFSTSVPEHLDWYISGFVDYADDPMQVATLDSPYSRTVDHQIHASLMGSIAFLDIIEVGLLVPVLVSQSSENLQPLLPVGTPRTTNLQSTALGDWRLSAKYQLFNLNEFPVGLAFVTALSLPFGGKNAFGSDGGVGAEAMVAADYVVFNSIRLGGNLGYRYRHKSRNMRDTIVGDEISFGVALHSPLLFENLDGLLELAGGLNIAGKGPDRSGRNESDVPVEIRGALRYLLPNNWT